MSILNVNGNPYTTATEDMRMGDLKAKFRKVLGAELTNAIKASTNGTVEINMPLLESVLDAAYLMGREDAS